MAFVFHSKHVLHFCPYAICCAMHIHIHTVCNLIKHVTEHSLLLLVWHFHHTTFPCWFLMPSVCRGFCCPSVGTGHFLLWVTVCVCVSVLQQQGSHTFHLHLCNNTPVKHSWWVYCEQHMFNVAKVASCLACDGNTEHLPRLFLIKIMYSSSPLLHLHLSENLLELWVGKLLPCWPSSGSSWSSARVTEGTRWEIPQCLIFRH